MSDLKLSVNDQKSTPMHEVTPSYNVKIKCKSAAGQAT